MTTQPTLAQLERAARHYCLLKGVDPEGLIKHQPVVGANGPVSQTPYWQIVGNAILDQWRLDEALRFATTVTPV